MQHTKNTAGEGQHDAAFVEVDEGVFEFAVVTVTSPKNYGKAFELDKDGKLQKTVNGFHERGTVRLERTNLDGLQKLLKVAQPGDHLTVGVPDIGGITAPMAAKNRAQPGDITRSPESFKFKQGPGLMVIDCDRHGDPDFLLEQMQAACPDFADVSAIIRSSSSNCIYSEETGEELVGVKSLHLFCPVLDASDLPRALTVLHERMWLAGHGAVVMAETGKPLLRSPVDLALCNPAQPVFVRAHVSQRLKQKPRLWTFRGGQDAFLDTRSAIPDLTAAERERLEEMQRAAEQEMAQAMADARAAYTKRRVAEMKVRSGISEQEAREHCAKALKTSDLYGPWSFPLADGTIVTVAEILRDPAMYHGQPCRDPLEHDYGSPSVAKIYSNQAKPVIHSNAHGGQDYFLHALAEDEIHRLAANVLNPPRKNKDFPPKVDDPLEILSKWFVTNEQVMKMKETKFIWKDVIASAHLSVWAAPGNGGKTTVAKLAAADLAAEGFNVLFFQEDAGAGDLPALHAHAEAHGYKLLNSTLAGGLPEDQLEALQCLARTDVDLSQYVLILDTLKKFADLMSKGGSREFFKLMRALTQRGATVVLLGHTNKHRGVDGKLIFEGVGDIRNDVDELFYLESIENPPRVVTITMSPDKVRSPAKEASFQLNRDTMILRSLNDVVNVKAILGREQQMKNDEEVIRLIEAAITPMGMPYTKVVEAVTSQSKFGARTVRAVLDRYVSADPTDNAALWIETILRVNNVRQISMRPKATALN